MKVLAFLAAILAVASAVNPAALYRSRCSEGASYWCETAMHADECGAVEYCIQNHWRGKIVQESSICSNCEAFVNAVHNVLDQTSVQDLILEGAEEACTVMGPLSTICKTVVETLGAEVLKKLVTELTADEVCHVLGFCKEQMTKEESPEVCAICKLGMNELNQVLSDTSVQQDIENEVLSLCPLLENVLPNCKQLVQDYFPQVIQFLLQYVNAQVCTDIGLCPGTAQLQELFENIKKLRAREEGIDLCSTCKSVAGNIDDFLASPAVQETVRLELDQLCYTLGTAVEPVCKYFVDNYYKQFFAALVQFLNPSTFCTEVGFCPSSMAPRPRIQSLPVSLVDDSKVCTDCKTFLSDIDGLLTNVTVQEMIEAQLDKLCDKLGPLADSCRDFVDQDGSIAFQYIVSFLDPTNICSILQLCTSALPQKPQPLPQVTGDPCTDCEAFFQDISGMLTNTTVQNLIIKDLEMVCDQLGSFADQCKSYVDSYASLVFSLLAQYINPQQICQMAGFCSAKPITLQDINLGADQCTDCKAFFGDIAGMLQNQTVQNLITKELEMVCDQLGSFADQCKSYVDQYGYLVFDFLASEIDPDTICSGIGFCSSSFVMPKVKQAKPESPQVCTMCKTLIAAVETYLSSETNQAKLVQMLDRECAYLGPLAGQCRNLVDTYASAVINVILSYFDPSTICTDITLCPGTGIMKKVQVDPKICNDCITFFTDVDTILSNQSVQQMILEQAEQLCSLAGSLQAECKLLIQTYGPVLFADLVKQLQPHTVCAQIGLCGSDMAPASKALQLTALVQPMTSLLAAKPRPLPAAEKVITDPFECMFCDTLVAEFVKYVEMNKTEEEILDALAEFCNAFSDKDERALCNNYVHDYGYIIIEMIKQELDPKQICVSLGFCSSKTQQRQQIMTELKQVISKLQLGDSPFCPLCQLAVEEIDTILSTNKSKEEIKVEFEKYVCGNLPSPLDQQCDSFMDIYGDVLIQLLLEQFDPKTFCADVGLCDAAQAPKVCMPHLEASTECILCEFMVQELENYIMKNSTQYEIRAALDKVCSLLPSTVASECQALVDEYSEMIIKYLVNKFEPAGICTAIGVCTTDKPNAVSAVDENCILCEYVLSELDKILAENATQQEIEAALTKVCDILPSTIQKECSDFIAQYTPALINYLTEQLPPKEFCTKIGLCTGAQRVQAGASVECAICEFVVAQLESMLSKNATQAEIEKALNEVCSLLPTTIRSECEMFVKEYEPMLIKLLLTEDPGKVCSILNLCSSSLKAAPESVGCDMCQIAVREFMNAIQEPSVTKEIVVIVNETCGILPPELKTECYTYVNQYGDLVTQFIAQFFDPITTCTLLGVCPSPSNDPVPVPKHLPGERECSRGPGFWCASMDNAKQCGMVEHCKRHVWN